MTGLLDIGERLASARRAQRITQRDLGTRLGTTQQQIARWEASDYRTASLERVASAAEALGLDAALPDAARAGLPVVAEATATYGPAAPGTAAPVRDLGEIAARLRAHSDTLRDRYRIDRIGVFGSFAVGEQTPDSDVDLLVETNGLTGFLFIEAAEYTEDILGRDVDFAEPDLLKQRLRDRALREAVYVWTA